MYYVITPLNKKECSFEILLDGKNHLFILDEGDDVWSAQDKGADSLEPGLIQQIGKAVCQRAHIKKQLI
ncbi:MAG: hypothetical protein ABI308_08305 [Mucilaginibacter sp.]